MIKRWQLASFDRQLALEYTMIFVPFLFSFPFFKQVPTLGKMPTIQG